MEKLAYWIEMRKEQFAYAYGKAVNYADTDLEVYMQGTVTDTRWNKHYKEPEIFLDFGNYSSWYSIWDTRITIMED